MNHDVEHHVSGLDSASFEFSNKAVQILSSSVNDLKLPQSLIEIFVKVNNVHKSESAFRNNHQLSQC